MKRRLFSVLALFLFCSVCYAQAKIEQELMSVLNRRSSELININIVFKSQINPQDLKIKTLNIVEKLTEENERLQNGKVSII